MSERIDEIAFNFPPEYDPINENSDISRLFSLMNEQKLEDSDAVVWFQGEGNDRMEQSIRLIQSDYAHNLILSGGGDKSWDTSTADMLPHFIDAGIDREKIILETDSKNTKEQAINVLDIVKNKKWQRIILVASPYHQIRAFLTYLAELKKLALDKDVELINAPAALGWFNQNPHRDNKIPADLLAGDEIPRMIKYSVGGDVAKPGEGVEYLKYWQDKKVKEKLEK